MATSVTESALVEELIGAGAGAGALAARAVAAGQLGNDDEVLACGEVA
jgi:hypothetical protein